MREKKRLPNMIECACGCGREFKPKRWWHIYFSTKCRIKNWHRRQVEERENKELSALRERVSELEKRLGIGIQ